ncbi:HNH endonuclease [Kibdelosporangium lantanae]|uniref:HNH endonuclease n=1 Tax=Kibdelosporangium lantanae TaxID=1497396 RepID=A0ABW3M0Y9_9PSEU
MSWTSSNRKGRLPVGWTALRITVLKRDRFTCQIRGQGCTAHATEVDHIQPGDNHGLENLRAVCSTCHSRKSTSEGIRAKARLRALRHRPADRHPGLLAQE